MGQGKVRKERIIFRQPTESKSIDSVSPAMLELAAAVLLFVEDCLITGDTQFSGQRCEHWWLVDLADIVLVCVGWVSTTVKERAVIRTGCSVGVPLGIKY